MLANIFKRNISPRVFIISIPKAGTYLLSEVLKNIGVKQTFLHISSDHFENYAKAAGLEDARASYQKFSNDVPMQESVRLVNPGEFAVGHIKYENRNLLKNFKILFLKRNVRDAVISYMNFLEFSKRDEEANAAWTSEPDPQKKFLRFLELKGKRLLRKFREIAKWNHDDATLKISYEQLTSSSEGLSALHSISAFLGKDNTVQPDILSKSLDSETLTKSPKSYDKNIYWGPDAEAIFIKLGGEEINKTLGY